MEIVRQQVQKKLPQILRYLDRNAALAVWKPAENPVEYDRPWPEQDDRDAFDRIFGGRHTSWWHHRDLARSVTASPGL